MGAAAIGAARLAREESGFTLIEVLVVSFLLAAILIPVMNSLDFAGKQAPVTVEYANAISDGTTGLQRMMTEIRQAYEIVGTNGGAGTGVGSSIDFFAVVGDHDLEIKYDCNQPYPSNTGNRFASSYHRCLRVSAAKGTTLPAISTGTVVIDRVLNPNVFTFYGPSGSPDPENVTYVQADVQIPARGPLTYGLTHPIVLDNGTSIPNLQNGT
jgi:prepilin-type N-terminal cleavage/methylation domain-containing protein